MEDRTHAETTLPIARRRVLVADSDPALRARVAALLKTDGIAVVQASNGFDVEKHIELSCCQGGGATTIDLVVCEARLNGKTGLEVLASLQNLPYVPPFVVTVAPLDRFGHEQARRLCPLAILEKPIDADRLRSLVKAAVPD